MKHLLAFFFLIFFAPTIFSQSASKKELRTLKKQLVQMVDDSLTRNELFYTYDEFFHALNKQEQADLKKEGDALKKIMEKWNIETNNFIESLKNCDELTIKNLVLTRDKMNSSVHGYSGQFDLYCDQEVKSLKIVAVKANGKLYILMIRPA